jgi:hypothetical protein
VAESILDEETRRRAEGGFSFQRLPRADQWTPAAINSAILGEAWPGWVPRVAGHPNDPDLPYDMSPVGGWAVIDYFSAIH